MLPSFVAQALGSVSASAVASALSSVAPQVAQFTTAPTAIVTSLDQTSAQATRAMPAFSTPVGAPATSVLVNKNELLQPFYGFGAALTDAACYVLMNEMSAAQRTALLTRAFGADGLSMVGVQFGSADYTASAYRTYDDVANDASLANFSVAQDAQYIIPVLQQIMAINPRVKVVAKVLTPPIALKNTASLVQGYIYAVPANFTTLANYFVKAIQAFASYGIPIWAVEPQNEPDVVNSGYPSCGWSAANLTTFIGSYLGPALDAAALRTKVLAGCVSWGTTSDSYVGTPMADATARPYLMGASYHWYSGSPLKMATDLRNYPGKICGVSEYFSGGGTSTNSFGSLGGGASPHAMCGAFLNGDAIQYGASFFLYWNFCLQKDGYPAHGYLTAAAAGDTGAQAKANSATNYQGLFDIDPATGNVFRTNPAYYAGTHLSKFVKPGARVVDSKVTGLGVGGAVKHSAFLNVDGSVSVFLYNNSASAKVVTVIDTDTNLGSPITLNAGDMATVSWSSAPVAIAGTGSLAKPAAPTSLAVSVAAGVGSLTWTAPASAGDTGVGRTIISRGAAPGAEVPVGVAPAGATSYADPGLVAGTTYYWTVQAEGGGGLSVASNEASGSFSASPPSAVTLGASGGNAQAVLTFGATVNGSAVTSFDILRGTTSGGESATPIANVTTGSTATSGTVSATYTDTTVTNGTVYYYEVVAKSTAGSTTSAEKSVTPAGVPATPAHYLNGTSSIYSFSTPADGQKISDYFLDLDVYATVPNLNTQCSLSSQWTAASLNTSNAVFLFQVSASGNLFFAWNDTAGSVKTVTSSVALPSAVVGNPVHFRVQCNNSSGAISPTAAGAVTSVASASLVFSYSLDGGNSYTQLGNVLTTVTTGFATPGASASSSIGVGSVTGSTNPGVAKFFTAVARKGSGAILYNPDFTAQAAGAGNTSTYIFSDTAPTPNSWKVPAGGQI